MHFEKPNRDAINSRFKQGHIAFERIHPDRCHLLGNVFRFFKLTRELVDFS